MKKTDDLSVEFCVVRHNNLPPRSKPRDTNDVSNRVTALESQVAELLSQRKSYVPTFSEITGNQSKHVMPSTSSEISRDLQSEDGEPPQTITDILPTTQIETSGNDQHVINIGLHDVKDN